MPDEMPSDDQIPSAPRDEPSREESPMALRGVETDLPEGPDPDLVRQIALGRDQEPDRIVIVEAPDE